MRNRRQGLLFLALWVSTFASFLRAQEIKGVVQGVPLKKGALGYYFGQKRLVADSLVFGKNGSFSVRNETWLPGFYTLYLDSLHALDFFYDGGKIEFTTHYNDLLQARFVDENNKAFVQFQSIGQAINQEFTQGKCTAEEAQNRYQAEVNVWTLEHGSQRIGKIMKARDPLQGITEITPGGIGVWTPDFWKSTPLTDPAIVRTPFLVANLALFFDQAISQNPDTIIEAMKSFYALPMDTSVRNYAIAWLTNHYEESKTMGHDKCFVWLVQRFYASGQVAWEKPEVLQKIIDKANDVSKNLIGSTAPDFTFYLPQGERKQLSEYPSVYTILYFFDATCGHCKETTPAFLAVHKKFASKGIQTLAITTEFDLSEWIPYLDKAGLTDTPGWVNGFDTRRDVLTFRSWYHIPTTPTMILLDASYRVIAKGLTPETVDTFLTDRLK